MEDVTNIDNNSEIADSKEVVKIVEEIQDFAVIVVNWEESESFSMLLNQLITEGSVGGIFYVCSVISVERCTGANCVVWD